MTLISITGISLFLTGLLIMANCSWRNFKRHEKDKLL